MASLICMALTPEFRAPAIRWKLKVPIWIWLEVSIRASYKQAILFRESAWSDAPRYRR